MATIRISRDKSNPYVVINKTALNDPNLSYKAKGIFVYLMSKPDDWVCKVEDLKNHAIDGRDSVYNGLKELRAHGYMIKQPIKNEKNIIIRWEEILYKIPQVDAKEIYQKQKESREKALIKRAETIKEKNLKSISGKSVNGKSENGDGVDIINNELLNNKLLNNESSSSTNPIDKLHNLFEEAFNKKITNYMKTKLNNYIEKTNVDFIIEVLKYCIEHNAKTASYLFKTLENLISKNIVTVKDLDLSITKHNIELENKKKPKKTKNNAEDKKKLKFANFTERNYDYDSLEKQLIGEEDYNAEALIKLTNDYI